MILVIARWYGIDPVSATEPISWTQWEYELARHEQIPVLAFILPDPLPKNAPPWTGRTSEGEEYEKLKSFVATVKSAGGYKEWVDVGDLRSRVCTSLAEELNRNSQGGLVRLSSVGRVYASQLTEGVLERTDLLFDFLLRLPQSVLDEVGFARLAEDFKQLVACRPFEVDSVLSCLDLAHVLLCSGDHAGATTWYNNVLKACKDENSALERFYAHLGLGRVRAREASPLESKKREVERRIADLKRLTDVEKERSELKTRVDDLLADALGNFSEAEQALRKTSRKNQGLQVKLATNKAISLKQSERWSEAIEVFLGVIEDLEGDADSPYKSGVLINIGNAHLSRADDFLNGKVSVPDPMCDLGKAKGYYEEAHENIKRRNEEKIFGAALESGRKELERLESWLKKLRPDTGRF